MKPILFSTLMVKAILEGRKTQTRRIIKPQPLVHNDVIKMPIPIDEYSKLLGEYTKKGYTQIYTKGVLEGMIAPLCKYEIGDVLWVRETWAKIQTNEGGDSFVYRADDDFYKDNIEGWGGWKPSLFMPRDACRLFLKIKNIRVERLQDISEEDSVSEGVKKNDWEFEDGECPETYKEGFKFLWESINGEKSWEDNPFVWVIEFEKHNEN
jgi:hypothetical protein